MDRACEDEGVESNDPSRLAARVMTRNCQLVTTRAGSKSMWR